LTRQQRHSALGITGATVLLTGLSGSGKSTVATVVEEHLVLRGQPTIVLDGDNIRLAFSSDLGFSRADRAENARRAGHLARLVAESGVVVLLALICPFAEDRLIIKELQEEMGVPYFEVFVNTPVEECERRDPKGLYRKARAGIIKDFTGVNSPYEAPLDPAMELSPADGSIFDSAQRLIELLDREFGIATRPD
jgi:bifunctional enzyme CysN/CysC